MSRAALEVAVSELQRELEWHQGEVERIRTALKALAPSLRIPGAPKGRVVQGLKKATPKMVVCQAAGCTNKVARLRIQHKRKTLCDTCAARDKAARTDAGRKAHADILAGKGNGATPSSKITTLVPGDQLRARH